MLRRLALASVVALLLLAGLSTSEAAAARPSKPPTTPEPPLDGTIYFDWSGGVYRMDPDGGNKTLLPSAASGPASFDVHGGERWFLTVLGVGTETYPPPYVDFVRSAVFAVSESGDTVQLTDSPDLMPWGVGWAPAPGVGRDARLVAIGIDFSGPEPVGGVYRADIAFADGYAGAVTGLVAQPTLYAGFPMVPDPVVLFPDVTQFSFAPDGATFVYDRRAASELWIWHGSSATYLIGPYAGGGVWSPNGALIAYSGKIGTGRGGIYTIRPDGTGNKQIATNSARTLTLFPAWSPTGSHLLYSVGPYGMSEGDRDIYRMTAGGSAKTNLTADIAGAQYALGWSQ